MSEAETLQSLLTSIQVIISLFSMFFALTSAYIGALFFFLNRAPFALRFLTFALLSFGMVFLGASALTQQRVQEALHAAIAKQSSPAVTLDAVVNPLPFEVPLPPGWTHYDTGVALGWITATGVYLGLAYMTFLYSWNRRRTGRGEAYGG
jgi:hypothetical protein